MKIKPIMQSRFGCMFFILTTVFCINVTAQEISTESPPSPTLSKVGFLKRQDESYLQQHYPFFFAYNESLSKLQISFKTPLMKTLPLFFGYTQLMFWDLHADSKPFRDLTYNPELFYRLNIRSWSLLKSIDLSIFNHTSNGKSGSESRSYERTNLRANFEKEFSSRILSFYIQWSYLYAIEKNNQDIRDYISPLAIGVSIFQLLDSYIDKSELAFQLIPGGRKGEEISSGGYQVSWSFRPGGLNIVPALYLQFYSGHAETLLNYNTRVDVFRAGFIF